MNGSSASDPDDDIATMVCGSRLPQRDDIPSALLNVTPPNTHRSQQLFRSNSVNEPKSTGKDLSSDSHLQIQRAKSHMNYWSIRKSDNRSSGNRSSAHFHHPIESQISQMRRGFMVGLEGYHSWLNLLLICVPFGIIASYCKWDNSIVFVLNFMGCVPLATILGRATEDVASYTNDTIGGLINATFGNAVEIILSISALKAGLMDVIKSTLVGSILSNLLLVLGSAFLFGGMIYREQVILPQVVEANGDLMMFAVFGFVLPSLFAVTIPKSKENRESLIEWFSLITSVCFLLIYGLYMLFQLYTHVDLYNAIEEDSTDEETSLLNNDEDGLVSEIQDSESDEPEPVASFPVAVAIMAVDVIIVSICCELLVGTIEDFSHRIGLGSQFVALILLPIIGNAVEHVSAVMVAMKDKMDLSIGIACGSSLQIAVFAAPFLVVVSWIIGGNRLTLSLDVFQCVCLWLSVTVVTMTLRDARTNWLEGAVLLFCYVIIATAFFLKDKV